MQEKTSVKIERDIATTLGIYCKINRTTMQNYLTDLLRRELADFESTLKSMRKYAK